MIVREAINFERGLEPSEALGLGLRNKISKWLKKHGIFKFIINKDLTVNVNQNIYFYIKSKELPIDFFRADNDFYIELMGLDTLNGCAEYVGGNFSCMGNNLKTLIGGPLEVGESYYCNNNKLTNLKGAPPIINGNFDCSENPLINLDGLPKEIKGNLNLLNTNISYGSIKKTISKIRRISKIEGDIDIL